MGMITSGDCEAFCSLARSEARRCSLPKRQAAEELFKLSLEVGLGDDMSRIVRDSVMQTRVSESSTKKRADGQISGLAGEFFVAAELLKRDIQTSVTFGNAKAIDLLAHNAETGESFAVQVKALRTNNYFLLDPAKVVPTQVYVFVLLGKPWDSPCGTSSCRASTLRLTLRSSATDSLTRRCRGFCLATWRTTRTTGVYSAAPRDGAGATPCGVTTADVPWTWR